MRGAVIAVLSLVASVDLIAQQPQPRSDWSITLGGGAVLAPDYPGSDEYRVLPLPMSQVMFRDRLYLGPSTTGLGGGLGAYVWRTPRLAVAAELSVNENRPASRSDALAGTDSRDLVATTGASVAYRAGPLEITLAGAQGLNDRSGLVGTAQLAYTRVVRRRVIATASVSASFANARQMRREFGVSEVEAQERQALIAAGDQRLRPAEGSAYRPGGGLRQVGGSASVIYLLSQRWSVLGFGGVDYLGDPAAESPLVRQREQVSVGLGLLWRM